MTAARTAPSLSPEPGRWSLPAMCNLGKAGHWQLVWESALAKSSLWWMPIWDRWPGKCYPWWMPSSEENAIWQLPYSLPQGGGLGLVRNLARWGIFAFTGKRLQAPLSGQRAATRTLLEQCLPRGGGFGLETELTLRALRRGFAVREIPTDFVHRGDGWKLAGIRHRGRQFFHVLAALARGGFLWRRR